MSSDPTPVPAPDIQIVEGLIVQPGDTLVIRIDPAREVSPDDLAGYRAQIKGVLPPNVALVVVAADQLALMLATEAPDDAR